MEPTRIEEQIAGAREGDNYIDFCIERTNLGFKMRSIDEILIVLSS